MWNNYRRSCGKIQRMKKCLNLSILKTLAVGALTLAPFLASAQIAAPDAAPNLSLSGLVPQNFTVLLNPEHPGALQSVDATLEDYAETGRAVISWYLNGKLVKQGVGINSFTFKTGGLGTVTNLTVVANAPDGTTKQQVLQIAPAQVILVAEANSYTPPFYEGKALPPYQGEVRFIALPIFVGADGKRISEQNLLYRWEENDEVVSDASGYGKNIFTTRGSIPIRPLSARVTVSSLDNTLSGVATLDVPLVPPKILLYEDNPLYGVLNQNALGGNTSLAGDEIKIVAIPYFFEATLQTAPALKYDWTLNGTPLPAEQQGRSSLVFRNTAGQRGTAEIGLRITNKKRIFQFGEGGVSVFLGK